MDARNGILITQSIYNVDLYSGQGREKSWHLSSAVRRPEASLVSVRLLVAGGVKMEIFSGNEEIFRNQN